MRTLSGVSNRSALPCAFGETVVGVDCPPRPLRDSLKALLRASHSAQEATISARVRVISRRANG